MTRPASRGQDDQVEAGVKIGEIGILPEKSQRRAFDAAALGGTEGVAGFIKGLPRLDLDKGENIAASGDDVDFAACRLIAAV